MKTSKKSNWFVRNISIWVLVLVALICVGIEALKITQKLDYRIYDALLAAGKNPEADKSIVLMDIGDESINVYGEWPWTRDILGDVLVRMKELGARDAVFDIEYLMESKPGPVRDTDVDKVSSDLFRNGQNILVDVFEQYKDYLRDGAESMDDAIEAADEVVDVVGPMLADIQQEIGKYLIDDYDLKFAQALQLFGDSSMTINLKDVASDDDKSDEDFNSNIDYVKRRFLFQNVSDPGNRISADNFFNAQESDLVRVSNGKIVMDDRGFVPSINKIISHAAGAGFTNVFVDSDGTRRRVELLNQYDGKYVGQLAFAPLIRRLDVQEIVRGKNSLTLKGALMPGSDAREDIHIPLDSHGCMLINWKHEEYQEQDNNFKHLEVMYFKYLDDGESAIYSDLVDINSLDTEGLPEDLVLLIDSAPGFIDRYNDIAETRSDMLGRCRGFSADGSAVDGGLDGGEWDSYVETRRVFFADLANYVDSLSRIECDDEIVSSYIQALVDETVLYNENFDALRNYLDGTFCIIGFSATASTDFGVTPFQKRYANMGTHANVVNTIIRKDFIVYVEPWFGILFSFLLALVVLLVTGRMSPARQIVFGFIYLFIPILVFILLMVFARVYVPFTSSILLVVIIYLFNVALNFFISEKQKSTLRRGFDAYVAPEVVSEIVKNPQLLALGGSNRRMTALFSDVRSFSAFTECINREEGEGRGAVRLVEILNGYLGVLSDAIMKERGTIDKYVGDEIVSFFGAPIENPNNAFDACVAGIRMKQVEEIYNREHLLELPEHPVTGTPFLLKSRVGINTGDMVVGNMGTEKKLNYTIMGNNVNLASRLEGTNKAYDSWIMASESTWLEANSGENKDKLVARMLDCVRVVNVEKPVQIYSIQGIKSEMKSEEIESAALFNHGMQWYLKGRETPTGEKDLGDFIKAKAYFEKAYACWHSMDEQDKNFVTMEKKMIARCDAFLSDGLPVDENGKPKPWDGVYTMKSK